MARALAMALLAILSAPVCAQPLQIPRADAPPVLDADLGDTCWADAVALDDFVVPGTHEQPRQPTLARLCHDGVWLYLGFDCDEAHPEQIVREQTERDGPVNLDDSVEVFISPISDRSHYYHFLLSANNIRADQRGWPARTPWRPTDIGWRSTTAVTEQGWVAEIALPLFMIQGGDGPWYLNLCRNKRTEPQQYSCLAPVGRSYNELAHFLPIEPLPTEGTAYAPVLTGPTVSTYRDTEQARGYDLTLSAENNTGQGGTLTLEIMDGPAQGEASSFRFPVELGPKDRRELSFFVPAAVPAERSVTLRLLDPDSGELRQWLVVADTRPVSPLSAWLDRSYYSVEDTARVVCLLRAPQEYVGRWSLAVTSADGARLGGSSELRRGEQMLDLPLAALERGEHVLSVLLTDHEGAQVARQQLTLERLEPRPTEVKIDRVRQVALVGGEPFFPLGMLRTRPQDLPDQVEAGFNTVSSFAVIAEEGERPDEIADAAEQHGLKLIEYLPRFFRMEDGRRPRHAGIGRSDPRFPETILDCVERSVRPAIDALRDHPALLAYYGIDEPSGELTHRACRHLYDGVHRMDPHHPLYELFSARVPEELDWAPTMDLLGVDPYMQMGHQQISIINHTLAYMASCTAEARRHADDMHSTLWIVPQSEYYSGSVRPLLPDERICQTFVALIYGARGLMYFRYPVYHQASWESFHEVTRRVRALMPALLTRLPQQRVEYLPREARRFDYPLVHACVLAEPDGTPVVLAANTEPRPAAVRFVVDGLRDGATVTRMFADDARSVSDRSFDDRIEGYGVRAYRIKGHSLDQGETHLTLHVGGEALEQLEAPPVSQMPPPERNLIANGELEGPEGWTPRIDAGEAEITFPEREDGSGRCLHIAREGDLRNACLVSDPITLQPDTRYRYGCEIRGSITSGQGRITMMMIGEDGHSVQDMPGLSLSSSSSAWLALSRTVTTRDEPVTLRVYLSLYRVGGEGWWDNVFIDKLGPAEESRNLLANSSFEHAALAGWPDMWWPPDWIQSRIGTPDAQWTQDFEQAYHGEASLRTTVHDELLRPHSSVKQGPEAQPGAWYCFSIYMKADEPGRRVTMHVAHDTEQFELSTEWQRYHMAGQFDERRTGAPEHVYVSFYCHDPGTYWADAAQCELGREPTEWVPDLFPGARVG